MGPDRLTEEHVSPSEHAASSVTAGPEGGDAYTPSFDDGLDELFDVESLPEPKEPEIDAETAARRERAARISEHVRTSSMAEQLVEVDAFLREPFSMAEEELAEALRELGRNDAYESIIQTVDERTGVRYLHDTQYLSARYAVLLLRSQANDPKYLVGSVVRENSQQIPEPTPVRFFAETEMFELTPEDVEQLICEFAEDPLYEDVRTVKASNGVVFFYSERFMSEALAHLRAEWIAVGQYLSP